MRTSAITILLILLSTVAYPQTVDTVATTEKRLEERKMIDGVVWVVGDEAILRSEV